MDYFIETIAPSLVILGFLYVFVAVVPPERQWARILAMLGFAATLLRYLFWRYDKTLPEFEFTFQSGWCWSFFLMECADAAIILILLVWLTRSNNRRADAGVFEKEFRTRSTFPKVDVFIVTYNEGREVLERTIVGALGMDYPDFRVWVLDDGKRQWVREFCESKGARYAAREKNDHAKAGNLNFGLALASSEAPGAFIMVLDADFVPSRNFLYRTMGFMSDEQVAIIQTPQHFFNPDPIQFNLAVTRSLPDDQRFFFDVIQPSREAWGVAICSGTSFVARRSSLEEVGGFPTASLTEDMLLTYRLMQHGYQIRNLDEPLSLGLAPEGFQAYLSQHTRWCLGTLQILFLRDCPLWAPRLTMRQRLSFFSCVLGWVVPPLCFLMALIVPLAYWFTGIWAVKTPVSTYLYNYLPFLAADLGLWFWLSRGRVMIIAREVSRVMSVFATVAALLKLCAGPFAHAFQVTPKGTESGGVVVHWQLLGPLLFLSFLNLIGMAFNEFPELSVLETSAGASINTWWSCVNLFVLLISSLACVELPRKRKQERFFIREMSDMLIGDRRVRCRIDDLSLSGASVVCFEPVPAHSYVSLNVQSVGDIYSEVIRSSGRSIRLRFLPTEERYDALIRKLYTIGHKNSVDRARPRDVLNDIARRAFGSLG